MKAFTRNIAFLLRMATYIVPALLISNLLIWWLKLDIGKIKDSEFLFTFFGVILGFALTIFTFLITAIEAIRDKGEAQHAGDQAKITRMNSRITALHKEIKDDIAFSFLSVIIIGVLLVVSCNIPPFKLWSNYYFSQKMLVESLKLGLFVLNLWAIYDLIGISFKISNPTSIIK